MKMFIVTVDSDYTSYVIEDNMAIGFNVTEER